MLSPAKHKDRIRILLPMLAALGALGGFVALIVVFAWMLT